MVELELMQEQCNIRGAVVFSSDPDGHSSVLQQEQYHLGLQLLGMTRLKVSLVTCWA